jgi:hypothetical protein
MDVSSESVPRKDLLSEKVSSLPSVQRSYTSEFSAVSELSGELVSKERGREPAVRQQPGCVGKGCQKSGCGGYSGCRVSELVSES